MGDGAGKKLTLRVDEVAAALGISRSLTYELAKAGKLKALRVGLGAKRGGLRIRADSIEDFLSRGCLEYENECLGISSTDPTDRAENLQGVSSPCESEVVKVKNLLEKKRCRRN